MTKLELIGWKQGIQTVSVIEAVQNYSTTSLVRAKHLVEQVLGGHTVELTFENETKMKEFKRIVEALGVICR